MKNIKKTNSENDKYVPISLNQMVNYFNFQGDRAELRKEINHEESAADIRFQKC